MQITLTKRMHQLNTWNRNEVATKTRLHKEIIPKNKNNDSKSVPYKKRINQ